MKYIRQNTYVAVFLIFSQAMAQSQSDSVADSLLSRLSIEKDVVSKVEIFANVVNHFMYNDREKAKNYADQLIHYSIRERNELGEVTGNFLKASCFGAMQQMDSCSYYLENTLKLAAKYEINDMVASSYANLSVIEGQNGNYVRAIALMDKVMELNLKEKDYLNYGVTLNNRAYHFYEQGDYLNAMKGFQAALNVLDTINREKYRRADVLRNIGKLNYKEKDSEDAVKYLLQAVEIYKSENDNLYQAYTLTDIGNVYLDSEAFEKATEFFTKSIVIGEKYDFQESNVYAYHGIGVALREQGKYRQALVSFEKGKRLVNFDESISNSVINLNELGYTYSFLGQNELALKNLNKSITICDSLSLSNELKNGLEYRSEVYEKNGDYSLALKDRRRMETVKDSLFNIEKTRVIEHLQTIYQTEKKEAEIALQQEEIKTLNEKAKVDKLTKGLYVGGMTSALALSGLLVFGFRQRIKKNRIEKEKISKELEHKQKELTSQTLHLVQKSQFIAEIKENLENLKNSPEKFKLEFKRIVMLLKKQSAADKDWEVFKSYFSEVHHDFDEKLKSLNSKITSKELRLASYVKMGLNNTEISDILNVLPSSIHTSKYRLKQKLNIDKDLDFDSFIKSL